jgi:eukaryotic-like serine/threonine-protein kinase
MAPRKIWKLSSVSERYRLLAPIAQGGMAEVFMGLQIGSAGFEKPVAIKRLLPSLTSDARIVEMFLDEARLIASVSHPNVCEIYDLFIEGGCYHIAMEYLEGSNLAALIEACKAKGIAVPTPLAIHIVARTAEGLSATHQLRRPDGSAIEIVHRDVSPDNIMLTFDGQVKLVDFGVARLASSPSRTEVGVVRGKCAYMSPEQVEAKSLDARSDVFSLGVVLHELLSGQPLFAEPLPYATMENVLALPIPEIERRRELPDEVRALVKRALERDPERRVRSARELAEGLEAALARSAVRPTGADLARFLGSVIDASKRSNSAALESLEGETTEKLARRERTEGDSTGEPIRRPGTIRYQAPHGRRWMRAAIAIASCISIAAAGVGAWFALGRGRATEGAPSAQVAPPAPLTRAEETARPAGGTSNLEDPRPPDSTAGGGVRAAEEDELRTAVADPGVAAPKVRSATKRTGKLTLDTVPWAHIYFGNRMLGTTPLVEVELPAGRQRLRAINPARHLDRTIDVRIRPRETTTEKLVW